MSVKLKVSRHRRFSAHHLFVHVARTHLDRAVLYREGSTLNILIAITFSAIGVEAISNSFGSLKVPNWLTKHERKSPMKKVRMICGVLAVPYEDDKNPWQALEWLMALRDRLAHAKPDLIVEEGVLTTEQYDALQADFSNMPMSDLELELTADNATRAVGAVEELLRKWSPKIPPLEAAGATASMWSGGAELASPDAKLVPLRRLNADEVRRLSDQDDIS
jgi:hypothetical protein